jgi:hypothetical protein
MSIRVLWFYIIVGSSGGTYEPLCTLRNYQTQNLVQWLKLVALKRQSTSILPEEKYCSLASQEKYSLFIESQSLLSCSHQFLADTYWEIVEFSLSATSFNIRFNNMLLLKSKYAKWSLPIRFVRLKYWTLIKVVTTNNYNTITDFHTLHFTRAPSLVFSVCY